MGTGTPTAEEFKNWLTPRQALTLVNEVFADIATTGRAVDGRLKGGIIRAAASRCDALPGSPVLIDPDFWNHLAGVQSDWWDIGDIRVFRTTSGNRTYFMGRFFDVRFERTGVETLVEGRPKRAVVKVAEVVPPKTEAVVTGPATPVPSSAGPSRAGRPRKEFWDDLIIATCKAIYEGDLKPQTQAEVERWMLRWASDSDHEVSETSVKAPAKKVFNAFQE